MKTNRKYSVEDSNIVFMRTIIILLRCKDTSDKMKVTYQKEFKHCRSKGIHARNDCARFLIKELSRVFPEPFNFVLEVNNVTYSFWDTLHKLKELAYE